MSIPNCNPNPEQAFAADKEFFDDQGYLIVRRLVPAELLKPLGDVIFFGSLTVHRSDANVSAHHRRCVVLEFDRLGNLEPRPGWGAPVPPVVWT